MSPSTLTDNIHGTTEKKKKVVYEWVVNTAAGTNKYTSEHWHLSPNRYLLNNSEIKCVCFERIKLQDNEAARASVYYPHATLMSLETLSFYVEEEEEEK